MKRRKRYEALKAMVAGATTEGERVAAQNALDRHTGRWGIPDPDPARVPRTLERIPGKNGAWCRWGRYVPAMSPELWAASAPDGKLVLMTCVKTRRVGGHKCAGCWVHFPKGSRLWRPTAYNGNHRMDRLCPECFAPDPKAAPAIRDSRRTDPRPE